MQKELVLSHAFKNSLATLFFYSLFTHMSQFRIFFYCKFSRQCIPMGDRVCMLSSAMILEVEVIAVQEMGNLLVLFGG